MGKDLARSARALGRDMNFFGDKEKDLVLQTKGRVKINFGDKFIELFNGSKFTVGNSAIISSTEGTPDSNSQNGFYFDESTGTLYLKWGDQIFEIFSNAESISGYVSYSELQELTSDEQNTAQINIGIYFETREDAISNGTNGIVYIEEENKAYILYKGQLYPITNNVEEGNGEENRYYFDNTVTINSPNDLALIIEGLRKYIQIGESGNVTNIYQTEDGGVIESNGSLSIIINDNRIVNIKNGQIDINSILNVTNKIITNEIYSPDFERNESGWGIWIDKSTGESYLQVDHIITDQGIEPEKIYYHDALKLIEYQEVVIGQTYLMLDFQNEWEITPMDKYIGETIAGNTWNPSTSSEDPSQYEDGELDPKFGLDRNVRPLLLVGKSNNSFEDVVTYFYKEDNKDIIQMYYDIRKEENYQEDAEDYIDYTNKGRIYYMRDSWNNEGPLDFKHYVDDQGRHVFNSPNNEDLSNLNTVDNIVCSNNRILDSTVKLQDVLNPMIFEGQRINNNTIGGRFENVIIGGNNSIIEYNYFNGEITDCTFSGTFVNNSIGCKMDSCEFRDQVVNNEFNKDVSNCIFYGSVEDNIFDSALSDCTFQEFTSNQFTGSFTNCNFNEVCRENKFVGDFSNCTWKEVTYSNSILVDEVSDCTFNGPFYANSATGAIWSNNSFGGNTYNNLFQSNVLRLTTNGYLNNNQFIGRINDVTFNRDTGNPNYGINNNIINGLFETSTINVDFSHNIITGPITSLNINRGEPGIDSKCLFNFNNITASSINTITINSDFRCNDIKATEFGQLVITGVFEYNVLKYDVIRDGTFAFMSYCNGSGERLSGNLDAQFISCKLGRLSSCIFRAMPIKHAVFRDDFASINFDSNTNILNLEKLYDEKHQVDIFYHNDNIIVSCQACNEPLKGEIKMFSGLESEIPEGWHICDGTEGTPNLIDKFIKGSRTAGETGGAENGEIILEANNIPSHNHDVELNFSTNSFSGVNVVSGNSIVDFIVDAGGSSNYCLYTGSKGGENYHIESLGSDIANYLNSSSATISEGSGAAGGGTIQPVNIEPPYYTLIFIMKL